MKTVPISFTIPDVSGSLDGTPVTLKEATISGLLEVPDDFTMGVEGQELLCPITTQANNHAFNGYTMVARSRALSPGQITGLGCFSQSAGTMALKVVKEEGTAYTVIGQVSGAHPGGGWKWLPCDIEVPDDGNDYLMAVYPSGFSSGVIDCTSPRAECQGDQTGTFTGTQNDNPTLALGAKYNTLVAGEVFQFDFDTDFEGWGTTWGPKEVVGGVYRAGVGPDDPNHTAGIGYLSLMAFRDFPGKDFTNAVVSMRIRGVNWKYNEARVGVWIQGQIPDGRYENYLCEHALITGLEDGQWHEVAFTLDPALNWTYAGNNGDDSQYPDTPVQGIAETLANIFNIHIPAVRPSSTGAPTGEIEIDWIKIEL